jgi:putative ABC transport system permease protein
MRLAFRQLVRSPGHTLTALAILGVGIGAGTAIFTVVNAVLMRPLDYDAPDRLVSICETNPSVERFCIASPPNVMDWSAAASTLESVGFAREWGYTMRTDGPPSGVSGGFASPGWFRALRVRPLLGRVLDEGDIVRGDRVVVLTHGLWVDRFGADPTVVGRTVTLDSEPYEIIGVLPASFEAPDLSRARLWTTPPWDARNEELRRWRGFAVAARLADGATIEQARAELSAIHENLARAHPAEVEGWGVRILPLHERVTGSARPALLVFTGAVALLVLVACANLANLSLTRASGRRREMAVRAAIGASRFDRVRPMLAESTLLSLGGALIGLAFSTVATGTIVRLAPAGIPRIEEVSTDPVVCGFARFLGVFTAAVSGFLPALRSARTDLSQMLRETAGAGGAASGTRSRRILVITEIAVTLMLLIGATLLVRSFGSLMRWDPGFDRGNVLAFSAFAPTERYVNTEQVGALWRTLEESLSDLPGVTSVASVSAGPVFGGVETDRFRIEGDVSPGEPPAVRWYDAAPAYFATLGVPVVRGRMFSEDDRFGDPDVAVINETLARQWFTDRDPIGRRVNLLDSDRALEIIGVVADVRPFLAGQPVEPEIWWSNRQSPRWGTFLVIRGEGDVTALAREIRTRIEAVDPEIQTGTPNTLEALVDARLIGPRFNYVLVGLLATLALVVAAAGVYAGLADLVAQRRREIAIRLALGETRAAVVGRMLREGAGMASVGIAIGTAGAFALSRFLESMLHGVSARDASTYAGTVGAMLIVAIVASLTPALRASRVDPASILKDS